MKARYRSLQPFIRWEDAERPIDWPRRFQCAGPLDVELGFGNGELLVRHARESPDRQFVGVEVGWGSIRRALRRTAQTEVTNVRFVLADARVALERLFRPQSIDRVRCYFPMPWPKTRHAKHRLFSHEGLRVLNSRLTADGEAFVVTDFAPYREWLLEQTPGTGFDVTCGTVPVHGETKYARKWSARGQERFDEIRLRKHTHIPVPAEEEVPMETYRIPAFDPVKFHPQSEHGELTVEFKEFLYDPQRYLGMVRVVVAEGGFTQQAWIAIACGEGGWYVAVAPGCSAIPTVGMQRALALVRDAAHPPATAAPVS